MNDRPFATSASPATGDESTGIARVELPSADPLNALRSCLPVLPVLATQLQEVARDVEQAVVGVCGSFQGMAARARHAAAQSSLMKNVSANGSTADSGGINSLISNTRETMGSLLQRIEQGSNLSRLTVERMQAVEGHLDGLDKILHEIDAIAAQSRLLALNGQIEAARLGGQGAAFAIVATETAKMANHAMASSKTIRKTTEMVSTGIGSTSKELRDRAATDTRETALSRDEVNRALDAMTALHEETQRTIEQSKIESDQLARDISAAVMAMQFQDTVNQRIGHVIQTLEEMHSELQSQMTSSEASSPSAQTGGWAQRMAQQYTMASEHRALAAHVNRPANDGQTAANNVELF
jgi:methyl-accepting chemotaxis protein